MMKISRTWESSKIRSDLGDNLWDLWHLDFNCHCSQVGDDLDFIEFDYTDWIQILFFKIGKSNNYLGRIYLIVVV